jgi:hypothetical protein
MPSCILGTKINGTIPISPLPPAQSVFVASTFRLFSADASTTTTTTTTTATDTTVSTTTATTTLDDIPVQKGQSIDIVDSIAGDDNDDDYDAQGFDSLLDQLGAANDHPPVEDVTPEKLEKMAERLRFFLSDANLRKDAFFRNFMFQKNPTIPVAAILRCNSVKIITQSPEVVVRAAQDLCSDFLFVADAMPDAAGRHSLMAAGIGRLEPFTADKMEENIPLTVYLGNLPYDDRYYATQQDIRDLFPGKEISVINFRFRRPSLKDEYKGKNKKVSRAKYCIVSLSLPRKKKKTETLTIIRKQDSCRMLFGRIQKLGRRRKSCGRISHDERKRRTFDTKQNSQLGR